MRHSRYIPFRCQSVLKINVSQNLIFNSESNQALANAQKWIDTIKTKRSLTEEEKNILLSLNWNRDESYNSHTKFTFHTRHMNFRSATGNTIKAVFILRDFTKQDTLSFEFSISKLIYGDNCRIRLLPIPVHLIQDELDAICRQIGIYCPPLKEWKIKRLDVSANFDTGVRTKEILNMLASRNISPRHRSAFFNPYKYKKEDDPKYNNGVSYYSASISTLFYDKAKEANLVDNPGILRVEVSSQNRAVIGKWLKVKDPKVSDLDGSLLRVVLQRDMAKLGLDKPTEVLTDSYEKLKKEFGKKKGYLYGRILHEKETHNLPNKDISGLVGMAEGYVAKALREMKAKGISASTLISQDLTQIGLGKMGGIVKKGTKVPTNSSTAKRLVDDSDYSSVGEKNEMNSSFTKDGVVVQMPTENKTMVTTDHSDDDGRYKSPSEIIGKSPDIPFDNHGVDILPIFILSSESQGTAEEDLPDLDLNGGSNAHSFNNKMKQNKRSTLRGAK